ncbi:exported hypothetical protein [Candidatus Sulfopaludibacter sp. SbA4]|nr:exported hypothetical protein [Candidatus Sulfopaludibacter sp. SbA4]
MRFAVLFAVYTGVPSFGSFATGHPAPPGFTPTPLAKPAPGEAPAIARGNFCTIGRPVILWNIVKTKEMQCAETGCARRC